MSEGAALVARSERLRKLGDAHFKFNKAFSAEQLDQIVDDAREVLTTEVARLIEALARQAKRAIPP